MTEFHRVTIGDKAFVDGFVTAENSRSADFNFGNIYLWDSAYQQELSRVGDRLLVKLKYEDLPFFAFPIGSGDIHPAIDAIEEFCAHTGCSLRLRGVTDEHRDLLEDAYPGLFEFSEDRDNFDYIYLAEKLATFAGKKLHGKRNFCNRFEKEHSWEFRRLTRELFPVCMEMLGFWQREFDTPPDGLEDEHGAIIRALMRWDWRAASSSPTDSAWASPWARSSAPTPSTSTLRRPTPPSPARTRWSAANLPVRFWPTIRTSSISTERTTWATRICAPPSSNTGPSSCSGNTRQR